MTKVYLVTEGAYLDYSILGVYSTADLAERAKVLYASDNRIEEYEIDAMPEYPQDGKFPFYVTIDANGNTKDVNRIPVDCEKMYEWNPSPYDRAMSLFVRATDEKHAVKIANEKRVQLIASGEWSTDVDAVSERRRKQQTP